MDIDDDEQFAAFYEHFEPALKDVCFRIWLKKAARRLEWTHIEFWFLRAFMTDNFLRGDEAFFVEEEWFSYTPEPDYGGHGKTVFIEAPILGKYRADFLIADTTGKRPVKCVVECDGHDYHERTKNQASRDRRRDREMQAAGYLVLRFTGSEIYASPDACVDQTHALIAQYAGSNHQ